MDLVLCASDCTITVVPFISLGGSLGVSWYLVARVQTILFKYLCILHKYTQQTEPNENAKLI